MTGLHRTIVDEQNKVYIAYAVEYFATDNGGKKLMQDMQKVPDTPFYKKTLFLMLYTLASSFYNMGFKLSLLSNTKAKKLGMKSPCLYLKPYLTGKVLLIIFSRIIRTIAKINAKKFGAYPSKGFKSQYFPGNIVTKKSKQKS